MEFPNIHLLLSFLKDASIPVCVVGELALNYYNVPRVVHDLELCVPANDLSRASSILEAQRDVVEKVGDNEYNIYTEYKRGFPRFRFHVLMISFCVVLFTDEYCGLNPLQQNLVSKQEHEGARDYYSKEILDCFCAGQLATLPLPRFAPFFIGFCRSYVKKQETTSAIAAEMLVDGMDLKEEWCWTHFESESEELSFALGLIGSKQSRISDFSPNTVTCFIVDDQERQRVKKIPGFC
ncbi:hypothetical protein BDBG_06425 [Blastomyces gilchristii SLH14081]|uniref:Uncharacterized protein n=1 Tax=Blastomyces gilchristii (strain SLH14081) TaxID=559298 RepID=A0A179UR76_BLAGS|nr:uncharacterized protein BDBG_06425 [Blastomyces gilchristii SLH14081]OAT10606.1 hypothetical protein BDBG_06425 [Blastomyces gilchristii SLH14081]